MQDPFGFQSLLGGGETKGDGEAAETAEAGKEPAAGTILQKSF